MPVDFGLLTSSAQIPMKAENAFNIDPDAGPMKALDMAGKKVDVEQRVQAKQQGDSDRAALTEAMHSGKYNLSDPDSIDSLLKDYSGNLSPAANQQLSDMANKTRTSRAQLQAYIGQADEAKLKIHAQQMDSTMPYVGQLIDVYNKTLETKGKAEADQVFQEGRGHILAGIQQQGIHDPDTINWISNATPEDMQSHYKGSAYQRQLIQDRLKSIEADKAAQQAENLKNPGNWIQYTDNAGNSYRENAKAGVTQIADPNNQDGWANIGHLPPDARSLKTNTGKAQSPLGRLMADERNEADPAKKAEYQKAIEKATGASGSGLAKLDDNERDYLANMVSSGWKLPALPLGQGKDGAAFKVQVMKDIVDEGIAQGKTPAEMASSQFMQKAIANELSNLQKQDGTITAAEVTAKGDIEKITDEIAKIGGPNSPGLREGWNKLLTTGVGDPKFSALNAYMVHFQETMARITSQQTGAGAPSKAYLDLAGKMVDKNANLEQWLATVPAYETEMTNRKIGVETARKDAIEAAKSPIVRGGGGLQPSGGGKPPPNADLNPKTEVPTALDDKVKKYFDVYLPQINNPQFSSDERKQALVELRKMRQELMDAGAKLPPITGDAAPAPAKTPPLPAGFKPL